MVEGIDPRRLPALTKYIERLKEVTFHIRVSETIPFDTPIFLTVEYQVEKFNPMVETYIVSVKDMDKDSLKVEFLAVEEVTIFVGKVNELKFIPISCVIKWREWTVKDAPLTSNYEYLSEAYKALAFGR
jgi:hypothetical protein